MNCCDYECNQGRDCPARSNKVAPIGKRYPRHADQTRPAHVHRNLRSLAKWLLIYLAMVLATALVLVFIPKTTTRVIDCSMSEFHPDIPKAVKEACRTPRTHT